jgi:hypothetical protein
VPAGASSALFKTASVYMRWARHTNEQIGRGAPEASTFRSLSEMRGDTARAREDRQSTQQQAFRRVLRDVAREHDENGQPLTEPRYESMRDMTGDDRACLIKMGAEPNIFREVLIVARTPPRARLQASAIATPVVWSGRSRRAWAL